MLGDCSERVSAANVSLEANSLITGKIQGILADFGIQRGVPLSFRHINQCLMANFPTPQNREVFRAYRELAFRYQGTRANSEAMYCSNAPQLIMSRRWQVAGYGADA